jgi:hypothetical protein
MDAFERLLLPDSDSDDDFELDVLLIAAAVEAEKTRKRKRSCWVREWVAKRPCAAIFTFRLTGHMIMMTLFIGCLASTR